MALCLHRIFAISAQIRKIPKISNDEIHPLTQLNYHNVSTNSHSIKHQRLTLAAIMHGGPHIICIVQYCLQSLIERV
jgi:hypothetical protein